MDILIDLIIWIIKAAADRSKKAKPPPITQQEIERQRALAAQLQVLQQAAVRAKPVATRAKVKSPSRPANRLVASQPRRPAVAPLRPATAALAPLAEAPAAAPVRRTAPSPARVPLRIPVLMGEILGPPAALREDGF